MSWELGSLEYPDSFREARPYILERDYYACVKCDSEESPVVHHIDYNKQNSSIFNLCVLCHTCNAKAELEENRLAWPVELSAYTSRLDVVRRVLIGIHK